MAEFTSTTIDFNSSSKFKASTPDAARRARVRRSSGPASTSTTTTNTSVGVGAGTGTNMGIGVGPPLSPSTSRIFNSTAASRARRHSSTGKKRLNASAGTSASALARRTANPNQPKPFADLKLEPGGVRKLLHKILDPDTQNLERAKLRDLVENPNPNRKSCRNLMQQFDTVKHEPGLLGRGRPSFSLGGDGDESVIDQLYASTIVLDEDGELGDGGGGGDEYEDEYAPTKLERLVQHLRESTDEFAEKYYLACKADYDTKRAAILAPRKFEETVSKLGQLNHAIKLMTGGPVARTTAQLLRETACARVRPTGIPCPAEDHARVVGTIMNLDRTLMQEQQKPGQAFDEKKILNMVAKKSQNMESELDKLSTLQQDHEGREMVIAKSITRLKSIQARLENMEMATAATANYTNIEFRFQEKEDETRGQDEKKVETTTSTATDKQEAET